MITLERPSKTKPAEFWRRELPALDEDRRVVRGGMWPHQRTWWDLPNFIKVLVAGYGAGKTQIGAKRIISLALTNAPCAVAAVSPTFAIARQTSIATMAELLSGKQTIYGRNLWWRYYSDSHEFRIRFHGRNAKAIIYSGDNPFSLRGPNLAAAWIDEPFIQEREVFDQMVARVRHPGAKHKEICCTGTSESLNWGHDLCVGELSERLDVGLVHASTRANQALDPGYVHRLEGALSEKAAQAYIEGAFVNLSDGLVYYAFDPAENVVELPTPEHADLGVGMDFNVNPMAACVFWRMGEHMHYFHEIELPNADTEYMCSYLREQYGDRLRDVYPDASGASRHSSSPGGKSDFTYISQAGFTINAKAENPLRKDRYNAMNGKLKAKSGRVTLTISPRCKKLIKYLQTYSHELMNRQHDQSHLTDSASYPCAYLFPVHRETLSVHRLRGF